jgi:HAD superfamily hydrolase (TIGR01484 family)
MKYKAIILDVDGTLVTYDYNALPSEKVQKIINKAREHVAVCIATGRSFAFVEPILQALDINYGLAIVNNGAQLIDIETKKSYYSQPMHRDEVEIVISTLMDEDISFFMNCGEDDFLYQQGPLPPSIFNIYSRELFSQKKIRRVIKKLSEYPKISILETSHCNPGLSGFVITHALATKQQGIWEAAKLLDIKPAEIVGVGDGYNDFPLLMACGLKVAMGNANEELKGIADYIAPSVENDGVAHVIEKYILASIDEI